MHGKVFPNKITGKHILAYAAPRFGGSTSGAFDAFPQFCGKEKRDANCLVTVLQPENGMPDASSQKCRKTSGIPIALPRFCNKENGMPDASLQFCNGKTGCLMPRRSFATRKRDSQQPLHKPMHSKKRHYNQCSKPVTAYCLGFV